MFQKIRTTVRSNGRVEREEGLAYLHESSVQEDMARERRALRNRGPEGRVANVEHTMTTMVVLYVTGTVVVTNWVAE